MTDLVVRKMACQFDVATGQSSVRDLLERVHVHRGTVREAHHRRAAQSRGQAQQRGQHASAHRKHMLALIEQYPGLGQCYERGCGSTTVVPI